MSYIYLVTNKINGKQYVGQHRYNGKGLDPSYHGSGNTLWRAYEKYGIENFTMELLEECSDEDLNPLEQLYIEHYDTLKNGYNETSGGDYGYYFSEDVKQKISNSKKGHIVSEETKQKLKGRKVSEETRKRLSESHKGYKPSLETRKKMSDSQMKNKTLQSKTIKQYDNNGYCVKTYPSIAETARQLGCSVSNIYCVLKGKNIKANGFRFRYADECGDKIEPYEGIEHYPQRQINQYTLDGQYIKTWNTITEAAQFFNKNTSKFVACCKGRKKSAYGFIWKYAD